MSGMTVTDLLRPGADPWVIAHRGASAGAPENTLPAFELAWSSGAAWVEADVQPTADDVPVILHDHELDRTTDGTGPVRQRTAFQVAEMDAGSWFPTGSTRAFTGTPVPRLAEVVQTLGPQRFLLLEIKGDHSRNQVFAEMAVVAASGWNDRVLFQSFEQDALAWVRSIEPDRPTGLLVERLHADPVAACAASGAIAYNPWHGLMRDRPGLVDELHGAGIAVFVWTTDEPTEWKFLTEIGVDGIITNTPAELLAWQSEHPAR